MRTIAAVLLPLVLALGACTAPSDDPYGPSGYPPPQPYPGPEPYPPQPYPPAPYPPSYPAPAPADYRAAGTEPFWDLTIGRDMTFTDRGTGITVVQPTPAPIHGVAGEIYRTQRLEVNIVHARCNDGMSDRTYPDTVQVYVDGRLYRGCGGASVDDQLAPVPPMAQSPGGIAPPLDRTRWRVVAINNRPTPRQGDYSMEFDAGRLSARFGCNSIGAGYTQTGSAIDAGAIIATQMACDHIPFEREGIAILDQVMHVSAVAPNRITLTSSAGTIELMRR